MSVLLTKIDHIINRYDLLKHSFYLAWSKGELSIEDLQFYAVQYYQQVQSFPRFISRVHTHCPNIEARKVLLTNLNDEELHGKDHPSLWRQFVKGLDVDLSRLETEEPIAETQAMVDTYYDLAENHWEEGLVALYAYESQVPQVSASKIAGLKTHYGIDNPETLEFFSAHEVYDVGHAAEVATLVEKYAEPERALQATEKAAHALWQFLDGICRVRNIHC